MSKNNMLRVNLSNYRCFYGHCGVELNLEEGKTFAIVGKNNTGKSALMRFFFELRNLLINFSSGNNIPEGDYSVVTIESGPSLGGVQGIYGIGDAVQIFPNQDIETPVLFSFQWSGFECAFRIFKTGAVWNVQKRYLTKKITSEIISNLNNIFQRTLYVGAHRNLVNQSAGGGGYYDLSVGSAFVAEWNGLKNGPDIEQAKLAHKAEDLVRDLLGWDSISINMSSDGNQLLVSTSKARFALTELGTGVSELVLCIITAAIKKPSWIFIDEPESHLHPALQVKFISALEQLASCGVVFTTHSIGLARTAADSILVMQQDKEGRSYLRPFEAARNYSELMGELQFSQFHDLGFDTILLCEGVTEVKTLRQFLRLWGLDSSVMLVPLGGTALIDPKRVDELSEFKRFGVKIFVLVDSERLTSEGTLPQRTKFVSVCESLFGVGHAIQTDRRATENYFPLRAIRAAKRSEKYRELGPFENGESVTPFWGKNQNWRVAAEMRKEDLSDTDLARFFDFIAHG